MKKEQIDAYLNENPFSRLSNLVFDLIEQDITSSNLTPGTKLNISKISEELNVSRTPVREALIKLNELGLVEKSTDKQGFFVSALKTDDISKIYFIRSMIESKGAYLCASQGTCPNINKLKKLINSVEEPYEHEKLATLDFEFHKLIILSSGNEYLIDLFNIMENKFKRLIILNLKSVIQNNKTELNKFRAEHTAVINSITANMPEFAEKEMINHINNSYNRTLLYTRAPFDL